MNLSKTRACTTDTMDTRLARASRLIAGTLCCGLLSHAALADDLQEIVVTATKREVKSQDVPATLTAMSGEQLSEQRILQALDLQGFVPNLSVVSPGGRDQPQFVLRGVGTQDYNPGTSQAIGIYQDEFYLNSFILSSEPYYDVDRIEVLNGPQGTLWGHNTTGGAINVITRKPTNDVEGYATLTYGSFNELDMDGAVGGPLIQDVLSGRVSFTHQSRDGWIHNEFDGGMLGKYDDNAERFQLLFTPNDQLSVLFKAHARNLSGDTTISFHSGYLAGGADFSGFIAPSAYNTVNQNVTDPIDTVSASGASITADWKLGFATLTMLGSYDQGHYNHYFDDDESPVDFETSHYTSHVQQENLELRLTSNNTGPVSWIGGVEYFNDSESGDQEFYSIDPTVGAPYYESGTFGATAVRYWQNTQNVAAYGNLTWHMSSQWSVIAGLRYTHERLHDQLNNGYYTVDPVEPTDPQLSSTGFATTACQGTIVPGCPVLTPQEQAAARGVQTTSEPTYDLTLQYQPTNALNFYARAARGYRGGGFNQGATEQIAVSTVQPEFVWDFEGGLKSSWLSGRLRANISYFHYNFTNLQYFSYLNNVALLANAASATYNGGEVELQYFLTPALDVGVTYGATDAVFGDKPFAVAGPDGNVYPGAGHRVPFTPQNTATVSGNYRFDLGDAGSLRFHAQWNYTGLQHDDVAQLPGPAYSYLLGRAYWVGNLRLAYAVPGDRLEVSAWVKNVTNSQPTIGEFAYPALELGGVYHIDPRTAGISLNAKF
jgi:iron complex outermembrane recepter protein